MTTETFFKATKLSDEIESFRVGELIMSDFLKGENSELIIKIQNKPFVSEPVLLVCSGGHCSSMPLNLRYIPSFIKELKYYIETSHIQLKQEFEKL